MYGHKESFFNDGGAAAVGFVEALLCLNGFGTSNSGDKFADGSKAFGTDITSLLQDASGTAWDGDGAEDYNGRNADQAVRMQWLAAADQAVADALAAQADAVDTVRQELAIIIASLAASTLAAVALYRRCMYFRNMALSFGAGNISYWTKAWALAYALVALVTAAVAAAVGDVLYLLCHLMNDVAPTTKHHLHQARDSYQSVVNDVNAELPTATMPVVGAPTASAFTLVDFAALASNRSSATNATDVKGQSRPAGGAQEHRVAVTASAGTIVAGRPSPTSEQTVRPLGRIARHRPPVADEHAAEQDATVEGSAGGDAATFAGSVPGVEATFGERSFSPTLK